MEPIVLIVVPGFIGGLVIGWLFIRLHQGRPIRPDTGPFVNEPLSTDVINMARIRVAGVGGLGLVAMALAVAWFVPRIGQTLAAGFVLGVAFAVGLILLRRRTGPMPSSGRRAGANTTLSIDNPLPPEGEDKDGSLPPESRRVSATPVRSSRSM